MLLNLTHKRYTKLSKISSQVLLQINPQVLINPQMLPKLTMYYYYYHYYYYYYYYYYWSIQQGLVAGPKSHDKTLVIRL